MVSQNHGLQTAEGLFAVGGLSLGGMTGGVRLLRVVIGDGKVKTGLAEREWVGGVVGHGVLGERGVVARGEKEK